MLRVIQAFGDHVVGESITDSTAIAEILKTEQAAFVVAVDDPESEQAPPAKVAPTLAPTTPSDS